MAKKRRRRRGRFAFLYRLLSAALMVGVVVAALTLFFQIDTVVIEGNQYYTSETIQEVTGIQSGDNLILLNKSGIRSTLLRQLPYIEKVSIHRELPSTLVIQVEECSVTLGIVQEDGLWLISPSGKIVAQETEDSGTVGARIDGCELLAPSIGGDIAFNSELSYQQDSLMALIAALMDSDLLSQVQAIHLGNSAMLTMDYGGRFLVELPYNADYAFKLKNLTKIVETLTNNETGRIDLRGDGQYHFLPY